MLLKPPAHHPSAQSLANFLIGDCSPGAALLVARHLEYCASCSARIQAMGAVGGAPGPIELEAPRTPHPGVEIARVLGVAGLGEIVVQVRAAAGLRLPLKAPGPAAEILVLEGGFTAEGATYAAGDFLSLEEHPLRQAVSADPAGCVCLMTCQDQAPARRR